MDIMSEVSDPYDLEPKPQILTISIRFKADLVAALRELADEENRSFNGTVNEACKRFVRQRRPRSTREALDDS